jgi:hypothetical protein
MEGWKEGTAGKDIIKVGRIIGEIYDDVGLGLGLGLGLGSTQRKMKKSGCDIFITLTLT